MNDRKLQMANEASLRPSRIEEKQGGANTHGVPGWKVNNNQMNVDIGAPLDLWSSLR